MPTNIKHDFYLGAPGNLRPIPDPAPGYVGSPDLRATVHALLSGGARVDRPRNSFRQFDMSFPFASDADKAFIELCAAGVMGKRLALVDANIVNQLAPYFQIPQTDKRGLVFPGSVNYAGPRGGSQDFGYYAWTPSATGDNLVLNDYVPVVPELTMVASFYASGSGTRRAAIEWSDINRSVLSYSTGSTITLSGGNQRLVVSATAPGGAVFARLAINVVATPAVTNLDGFQFEYVSLTEFTTGLGAAYVAPVNYTPVVEFAGRTTTSLALQEVI